MTVASRIVSGFTPSTFDLAIVEDAFPYIEVFPRSESSYGMKYLNPSTLPPSSGTGVAFSPDGQNLAVTFADSPGVYVYQWSSSGFGTKYTDLSPSIASVTSVDFNPYNNSIVFGTSNFTSPLHAYSWSASGFGTKYTDPSLSIDIQSVAFSPDGKYVAGSSKFGSPRIVVFPWSESGFGTQYANPATPPSNQSFTVTFSNNNEYIAATSITSPDITVYPWSNSGFGSKYADPSVPANFGAANSAAFSPSSSDIAIVADAPASSGLANIAYPWSNAGFGTRYADPSVSTQRSGVGKGVEFSPDGSMLAAATGSASTGSKFFRVYKWLPTGFGTQSNNGVNGTVNSLAWRA